MPGSDSSHDLILEQLAAEFVESYRRGEEPKLSEFTRRHPDLAGDIVDLFPALVQLEHIKPKTHEHAVAGPEAGSAGRVRLERLGDYRIVRELGRGGMGVVYEAEQESLGRHVALKVLPTSALLNVTYLERFKREAKAAARLHHTNIVPVFGVGEHDGVPYYAMQFIRGEGLDRVLVDVRRLRRQQTEHCADPLGPPNGAAATKQNGHPDSASETMALSTGRPDAEYYRGVARIGVQVAEALAYAHRQGILHRDIKPSNLLLDLQGTVWVTDFGLAKAEGTEELTQTGDIVGTIRYMAPERFDGKSMPQSDVYGLGITLYELLALQPAFDDSNKGRLIDKALHEPPVSLRKLDRRIPRDLETIVLKCVAKNPRERYASAEALAGDLHRFLADRPIRARRATTAEQAWRWCRRNPAATLLIVASLATLVSLGVAVTAFVFNDQLTDKNNKLADAVQEADRQRHAAEQQMYVNKITLAGREWGDCNIGQAERLLAECPPHLRGWEWHFVMRHCHLEMNALPGHTHEAHNVVFHPDGTLIASCGLERVIRLWDASTGRLLDTRIGPAKQTFRSIAFSADGRFLAAGGAGTVRVWNAAGVQVAELKVAGGPHHLAFSPSGDYLVSGGWGLDPHVVHGVVIWDTARWQTKQRLSLKGQPVLAVGFDATGDHIVAVFGSSTLNAARMTFFECKTWNVADGKQTDEFQAPALGAAQAALSLDGRWLATTTGDGTIRLWDRAAKKEVRTFAAHTGNVTRLTFSPDSQRLGSCGDDRSIRIWDVASGRNLGVLRGHIAWVNAVAFQPGGHLLASASDDSTVRIWDTQKGMEPQPLAGLGDIINCAQLSADGRWFVVQKDEPESKEMLWDARSQKEVMQYPIQPWGNTWYQQHPASLSRDEHWFANHVPVRTAEGEVRRATKVWDVQTGQERWCFLAPSGCRHARNTAFAPDSRHLAVIAESQRAEQLPPSVQLCDIDTGQITWTHTHTGSDGSFLGLTFTPDGMEVVTVWLGKNDNPSDKKLVFLDVITGQVTRSIPNHASVTPPLIFAPMGDLIASTATESGTVQFVNPNTGKTIHTSLAHNWMATALAFSPDGRRLASGSHDRTIKIWDTVTGQETLTLSGHRSPVTSVWFSPDGHRLMSCDKSGNVCTWDGTPVR